MAMVGCCGDYGYGRLLWLWWSAVAIRLMWQLWLWLAAVGTVAPLMAYVTNTR
jgi:hypothetical protein